jgi:hypothetical protein
MMRPRRLLMVPASLGLALAAGSVSFAGDLHRLKHSPITYAYPGAAPAYASTPGYAPAQATAYYQAPAMAPSYAPAMVAQAPTYTAMAPVASAPIYIGAASSASAPPATTYTITSTGMAPTTGLSPTVGLAPSGSGGRDILSDFQRRAILQDLRDYKVAGEEGSGESGRIDALIARGRERYLASLNASRPGEDDEEASSLTSEQFRDLKYLVELAVTTEGASEGVVPLSGIVTSPYGAAPLTGYTQQVVQYPNYGYAQAPLIQQAPMYAPQPQAAPLVQVGNLVPKTKHFHPNQPPTYRFKGL